MNVKPVILVTRKMPDAVEARLKRDYSPILNPDDKLYSEEEIIKLASKADAILPCHTERMTADLIRRLPHSVKAIANFSVGVDHCDLEAARNKVSWTSFGVCPSRGSPVSTCTIRCRWETR